MNARSCCVLVPFSTAISAACQSGLDVLAGRNYEVRRVAGYSAIDQARNQMASDALADGFDETLWIDADVGFDPDDVERLRSHDLPIACGIYPRKGSRELSCHLMPSTDFIVFGREGGLLELMCAATGFLLVRRPVYEAIHRRLHLPVCNQRFGRPLVPYFQPTIIPDGEGHWYLAEDFAFCERARQVGFQIFADTRIRLFHFGEYGYSWEDAGSDQTRYGNYRFEIRS